MNTKKFDDSIPVDYPRQVHITQESQNADTLKGASSQLMSVDRVFDDVLSSFFSALTKSGTFSTI